MRPPNHPDSIAQERGFDDVYCHLSKNTSFAISAFAYALYNTEKAAFIEAIQSQYGRSPSAEEMAAFHTLSCTQPRIDAYLNNAVAIGQSFLDAGLKDRIEAYRAEVRTSVLGEGLNSVMRELRARKTWWMWMRDAAGNLGVNIATILLIGFLLGGYNALNRLNANIERMAQLPQTDTPHGPPATGLPAQ